MSKATLNRPRLARFALVSASCLLSGLSLFAAGTALRLFPKTDDRYIEHRSQGSKIDVLGSGARDSSGKANSRRTIHGSGYEPKLSFEELLSFPRTSYVFEGVVEKVLEPRHVYNRVFEHVYSPVVVRITSMHRGEKPRDGQFILRAFGGVADDVEFVGELEASEELRTVGSKILVIAPEPVLVEGDSLRAATAIGVYARNGDALHKITYAHSGRDPAVPLERAQALLGTAIR